MSRRGLVWVARILLAALFAFAGVMKLSGNPDVNAGFERLAMPWLRIPIGVLELAGALGLLLPPLAVLAAAGLALVMVGAVLSHWLALGGSAVPALVVLALCLFVFVSERANIRFLATLVSGKGPMDGWVAHVYDRGIQTAFRGIFPELAADILPRFRGARRVLDVGCGPGQFTIMIAEALPEAEVVGVDLAPTMLEIARRHAAASPAAARVSFKEGDATALPFPDASFDAVISSGSIKQWPDPAAGVREIYRVLVPGGRAFVAEMNSRASDATIAAVAARAQHWFIRRIMPRVLHQSLAPEEAAAIFAATPFGSAIQQRFILDGFLWGVEAQKAGTHAAASSPSRG